MRTSLSLSGFKELEKALSEIEKASTRKAVSRRALKKGGEPIAQSMRQKAPRDDGQLQDNITVSAKIKNEAGKAAFAQAMRQSGGLDKETAVAAMRDARRAAKGTVPPVFMYVGPTVKAPHAHLVEFGTAPHVLGGRFEGAMHPGTAPQPFARPAWDEQKEAALQRIGEELGNEIMKNARRAASKARKAARG